MFNPIPQMIQPSQHRRGALGGTRIMAGLALVFSFLAFLMAGVVMLRTGPEGGGLKANIESFRAEAAEVLSEIGNRFRGDESGTGEKGGVSGEAEPAEADTGAAPESALPDENGEGDGSGESGESLIELDRIRERVDEIEDKVLSEDESAGDLLDGLREDLAGLKDFSKEDRQALLDRIGENLTGIRKTIAEDSAEAARRLRALSEDLVRRSREQTEQLRGGSEPTPEG